MKIRRVVSVCEIQDVNVWRIAAPRVLKYIDSDEYMLICPDDQVSDFVSVTSAGWKIVGESSFDSSFNFERISELVTGENKSRVGWLFQQFLKINAIIDHRLKDDDLVLIWDADTVPLRKLEFTDSKTGTIEYYYSASENRGAVNHQPYFETIKKLLGLEKRFKASFIAQCFPTKVGWAREAVGAIVNSSNKSYIEIVLNNIPGISGAEFSEYETMGTWNYAKHYDSISFKRRNNWSRNGARLLGSKLDGYFTGFFLWVFSINYDFVSFEKWQRKASPIHLFTFLKLSIKMLSGKL